MTTASERIASFYDLVQEMRQEQRKIEKQLAPLRDRESAVFETAVLVTKSLVLEHRINALLDEFTGTTLDERNRLRLPSLPAELRALRGTARAAA